MNQYKWTLDEIQTWTQGQIISQVNAKFNAVGTDTRVNLNDHVFVALKGDQFDAHHFLDQAVQGGAGALIIDQEDKITETLKRQVSIILVPDTLKALQDFAHGYRQTLKAQVVGITGSNGKTTTKEFLASILAPAMKVHYNQGSFNNHWGVPLTLLSAPNDAEVIISEMGMNHAGELTQLVKIAKPNIVVCTMVGSAHIEFFGSSQKIAEAKSEIYLHTDEDTVRVFNQDQDLTFDMMYPVAKKFPASRMLSFSEKNKDADVHFKIESSGIEGLKIVGQIAGVWGTATVPVFGEHNIINLMAASCLAYVLGLKPEVIWKNLSLCHATWGRNEFIKTEKGVQILFDGYNANPESMRALINNTKKVFAPGRKIALIGQMKELGAQARTEHIYLAEQISEAGFDAVFFIGENFNDFEQGLVNKNFKTYFVASDLNAELKTTFLDFIQSGDFLVVKGSRGAKTERFVELCSPIGWKTKN